MARTMFQLWLKNDPDNGGKDLQCWFQGEERAIRETWSEQFAAEELRRIQRANPGLVYELRTRSAA